MGEKHLQCIRKPAKRLGHPDIRKMSGQRTAWPEVNARPGGETERTYSHIPADSTNIHITACYDVRHRTESMLLFSLTVSGEVVT